MIKGNKGVEELYKVLVSGDFTILVDMFVLFHTQTLVATIMRQNQAGFTEVCIPQCYIMYNYIGWLKDWNKS